MTKPVVTASALLATACLTLGACDIRKLAGYPDPPAGSFTAVTVRVSADGVAESVPGATVTPDFFRAYPGMSPLLGRHFIAPDDYAAGASRVALLSEDLWRRRFGAGPEIIGKTIDIDGAPVTIVGILPDAFRQPPDAKCWLPKRP
jgi:hypothetical protein